MVRGPSLTSAPPTPLKPRRTGALLQPRSSLCRAQSSVYLKSAQRLSAAVHPRSLPSSTSTSAGRHVSEWPRRCRCDRRIPDGSGGARRLVRTTTHCMCAWMALLIWQYRFLLKYTSRDSVDIFTRGTGGATEARGAIATYEEKSPLYGFLLYRRRKVLIKCVPEGTSRLLQGMPFPTRAGTTQR